jgi:hypothetical protein
MFNDISEEERKRYERLRDEFRVIKDDVEERIGHLEETIRNQKTYLEKIRPKIPGAEKECSVCEIISMKCIEKEKPSVFTMINIYQCSICGNKEEDPIEY